MLPLLCLVEMAPVHLLLERWSPVFAWLATSVTLYSAIWLIGLARAFRLRPVLLGPDNLYLRYGLLFQLQVPIELIAQIRNANSGDKGFAVPRKSAPTLSIEFTRQLQAEGFFGIQRRVRQVAITPDDEPAFRNELANTISRAIER